MEEFDPFYFPSWAASSFPSKDSLNTIIPSNEDIIKAMVGPKQPWIDMHHWSSFLPSLDSDGTSQSYTDHHPGHFSSPTTYIFPEGNLANIAPMMAINISIKLGIIKNTMIGANCSPQDVKTYTTLFKEFCEVFSLSYKEILGIEPQIVKHEIKIILMPNLFDKTYALSTLERHMLLMQKLKDSYNLASYTLFLL